MLYKKIYYLLVLAQLIALHAQDPFFVVVIPSYNNEKFCKLNLDSVFNQTYKNFRVIYINDCSTDNTASKVEHIIGNYQKNGLKIDVKFINNSFRRRKMANMYNAIHSCNNCEIVVEVDGDDSLVDKDVLLYLSKIYKNPNVWATYGQFRRIDGRLGFCKEYPQDIIKNNKFRFYPGVASAPRTFYAGIFKLIKKSDLMLGKNFIPSAADIAYWTPILEMASLDHFKFISHVLYVYNDNTGNNDHVDISSGKLQYKCAKEILSREAYSPLLCSEDFLK